jgi:hypothetical protein
MNRDFWALTLGTEPDSLDRRSGNESDSSPGVLLSRVLLPTNLDPFRDLLSCT